MKRNLIVLMALAMIGLSSFEAAAQEKEIAIVAHRGFWNCDQAGKAKNSLAALEQAQKNDFWGSEFDVNMTKDGELLVFHDGNVEGKCIEKNPASVFEYYRLKNGESIPTLDEYLIQAKKYPATKLILEIKGHNTYEKNMRVAKACYDIIKNTDMQDQVEYISFNYDICKKIVEYDPSAMVQYLAGNKKPADLFKDGIRGIDYQHSVLTDEMIEQAHELGMTVNVWTVNGEQAIRNAIEQGVDFITSDAPELVQQIAAEK